MENLLGLFLALVELVGVCAYDNYAEIYGEIANIDMKQVLFGNAGDANRGPRFPSIFHAGVGVDIVEQDLDILRLQLTNLVWISEYSDWIH